MAAILLAVYTRTHYVTQEQTRGFGPFRRRRQETVARPMRTYLVFIPWKHREKETVELLNGQIVDDDGLLPEDFVRRETFCSQAPDGYPVEIRDFVGYPFLLTDNAVLCHQALMDLWDVLDVLYANLPELLDEEFDEEGFAQ